MEAYHSKKGCSPRSNKTGSSAESANVAKETPSGLSKMGCGTGNIVNCYIVKFRGMPAVETAKLCWFIPTASQICAPPNMKITG